jgi:hypothetical protein
MHDILRALSLCLLLSPACLQGKPFPKNKRLKYNLRTTIRSTISKDFLYEDHIQLRHTQQDRVVKPDKKSTLSNQKKSTESISHGKFSHPLEKRPMYTGPYLDQVIEYFAEKTVGYENFLLEPGPKEPAWQKVYSIKDRVDPSLFRLKKKSPKSHLVVEQVTPQIGSGVFLSTRSLPIPADTLVGFYYGDMHILCEDDLEKEDSYLSSQYVFSVMRFKLDEFDHAQLIHSQQIPDRGHPFHPENTYILYVDAEKKGNLTRYINHSTHANCAFQVVYLRTPDGKIVPTPLVRTTKMIESGEQLLLNYGKNFFKAKEGGEIQMTPQTYTLSI